MRSQLSSRSTPKGTSHTQPSICQSVDGQSGGRVRAILECGKGSERAHHRLSSFVLASRQRRPSSAASIYQLDHFFSSPRVTHRRYHATPRHATSHEQANQLRSTQFDFSRPPTKPLLPSISKGSEPPVFLIDQHTRYWEAPRSRGLVSLSFTSPSSSSLPHFLTPLRGIPSYRHEITLGAVPHLLFPVTDFLILGRFIANQA